MNYLEEWPKPTRIPYCSLALLLINCTISWFLLRNQINIFWVSPFVLLNVFFLWAEIDEYKRKKRLYLDWLKQVEKYRGYESIPTPKWQKNLFSVRKKKRPDRDINDLETIEIYSGPQTS